MSTPRTEAKKEERPTGLALATGSEIPLLTRLQNHLCMMAPHQRARHAGKLLIEATQELAKLTSLLSRCLPIVQADAQMMADITRHAPLDPASQVAHDSTEYESERLAREIPAALHFPNVGDQPRAGSAATPEKQNSR